MTTNDVELCVAILEDYFGYYVSTVGNVLLCNQLPLLLIIRKLVPNMGSREVCNLKVCFSLFMKFSAD